MLIISVGPEETSLTHIPLKQRLYCIMQSFAGVGPNDNKWRLLFKFGLNSVFTPVTSIIGAVFYNECSAQPELPQALIATGVVEALWVFLIFYIFIHMPRNPKEEEDEEEETDEAILLLLWFLTTLALGGMVILTHVYLVFDCDCNCYHCTACSKWLLVTGYVWLGFKYLNLARLVICVYCSFRQNCKSS